MNTYLNFSAILHKPDVLKFYFVRLFVES